MHSVSLVRGQFVGAPARSPLRLRDLDGLHDFLEGMGLVNLASRDFGVQRHSVAIADQVNLGAKTASGTA